MAAHSVSAGCKGFAGGAHGNNASRMTTFVAMPAHCTHRNAKSCTMGCRRCRWHQPRHAFSTHVFQEHQNQSSVSSSSQAHSPVKSFNMPKALPVKPVVSIPEKQDSSHFLLHNVPLEGELRSKFYISMAGQEDDRMEKERVAAGISAVPINRRGGLALPPLPPYAWKPRWTVMRGRDAFPGQDVGRPIPALQLGQAKAFCEGKGFGGMVMWGRAIYIRPHTSPNELRNAAELQETSDLFLRPLTPSPSSYTDTGASRPPGSPLRIAIVATQDEFDETSFFDIGMVSNQGNGRRYAAQTLLREIIAAKDVELTALLLYDWKNKEFEKESTWPIPAEGPERVAVTIRGLKEPISAWRGSLGQLLGAATGELHVDVGISIQSRRTSVELMHRAISAKRYIVMGHDYNLPYGPWGMEVEFEQLMEHRKFLEEKRTVMFCTSQHLENIIVRFSEGRVQTRLCYCADYGYFDPSESGTFPPKLCEHGDCVTLISPCPAKGLPIVLRLALTLPDVKFLCVSTSWTKTLHEVQLRAHPNIEVVQGTDDIDSIYQRTAVLLMPSLWQESFGLVAVEAQLRGIPVLSTDTCGLSEANFLEELRVGNLQMVHDSRTRELMRGITMEKAEKTLDPLRPGHESTAESVHAPRVREAHTIVATEKEAAGFIKLLRMLIDDPNRRCELGRTARQRSIKHVEERKGRFIQSLQHSFFNVDQF